MEATRNPSKQNVRLHRRDLFSEFCEGAHASLEFGLVFLLGVPWHCLAQSPSLTAGRPGVRRVKQIRIMRARDDQAYFRHTSPSSEPSRTALRPLFATRTALLESDRHVIPRICHPARPAAGTGVARSCERA